MAEDLNVKKKKAEALRFLGKGKIDKAIEVYEGILKAKEDPDIFNSVGDLYVRKQNISKAIESYEKAFRLYKDIEFLDNAVAVVRKILKYEKDRKDLYLELAELYTELGNQDEALGALESVITDELDPSMLERAFSIITQLAEKVQEDESSIKRFERLFVKLQEISEKFGEISLESGMGMEMGTDENFFAPSAESKESEEKVEEQEEGLVLEEPLEESEQPSFVPDNIEQGEEAIFEEETTTREKAGEKDISASVGIKHDNKDFYNAPEAQDEEEFIFEESPSEPEPVIEERDTEEVILPEEEPVSEENAVEEPVLGVQEAVEEESLAVQEAAVKQEEPVYEEVKQEENVSIPQSTMPTEEIISQKPVEREKPPTTTHRPEVEPKYYEEFKDVLLTFIEEMGEADINELYDFVHPFDTAFTLYRMDLYDVAIDHFQIAMRDSEYRLKAMEMVGRIFYEMGNYEMAVKMLEKSLDEGGYDEHEYTGIRYYLARSYESIGLEDKALEHYESLFLIDRNHKNVSERIDALKLKRMKSF